MSLGKVYIYTGLTLDSIPSMDREEIEVPFFGTSNRTLRLYSGDIRPMSDKDVREGRRRENPSQGLCVSKRTDIQVRQRRRTVR